MRELAGSMGTIAAGQLARLRRLARTPEAGVSTLEMVIIAVGLMAVAALLVAAVTTAVTSRTDQIR